MSLTPSSFFPRLKDLLRCIYSLATIAVTSSTSTVINVFNADIDSDTKRTANRCMLLRLIILPDGIWLRSQPPIFGCARTQRSTFAIGSSVLMTITISAFHVATIASFQRQEQRKISQVASNQPGTTASSIHCCVGICRIQIAPKIRKAASFLISSKTMFWKMGRSFRL